MVRADGQIPKMKAWRRLSLWAVALLAAWICGCSLLRGPSPQPKMVGPATNSVVRFYADFTIPTDHPIYAEPERLQRAISRRLGLPPAAAQVHVYLFSAEDQYRTFVHRQHPSFPDRRAYFFQEDGRYTVYALWSEQIHVDLRHELTHAYLRAAWGLVPLWLDEGVAEYFEVSADQEGLNRVHLEELSAALTLDHWSPDLSRLENLRTAEEMTQRDYAEAWCWVHWLLAGTDDESASLLLAYIRQVRSQASPPKLSDHLYPRIPNANQLVRDHIQQLRKPH